MRKIGINKPFFFLFLVLTISILTIPTAIMATDFYITNDEIQTTGSFVFRANSKLPVDGTYHINTVVAVALIASGKRPDMVRIYLKDPLGNIKYRIAKETDGYGFTNTDFVIELKNTDLRVPAFAQNGVWRVEITWYNKAWGVLDNHFAFFNGNYIVGESSITDNIMAPIYIYFDAVPVVSKDDICFALPGIFFLSMLVWIPVVSIGFLKYTKTSYKIGMHLFKKQIGGNKNAKKSNK